MYNFMQNGMKLITLKYCYSIKRYSQKFSAGGMVLHYHTHHPSYCPITAEK